MLRDGVGQTIDLLSKSDSTILEPGELLRGIGGGHLLDVTGNAVSSVPWLLPDGDRTWVELSRDKKQDDGEYGKPPKFTSGTIYSQLCE